MYARLRMSLVAAAITACNGIISLNASESPAAHAPLTIDLKKFQMVWHDEFDGSSLDMSKWKYSHEEERQGGSRWDKSLATVKDGMLHLGIKKTSDPRIRYACGAIERPPGHGSPQPTFEQCYGYYEARCKLPRHVDADYWAAFWLMAGKVSDRVPDTRGGCEIDIMESFTFSRKGEHKLTLHWSGYGKAHNSEGIRCGSHPNLLDGEFHVFGLYWDEQAYVSFVDGIETGRSTAIGLGKVDQDKTLSQGTCRKPATILLTCEAAEWPGKSNKWEKEMPEEDDFAVDYVRVYEGHLPPP